jgi:hypothetical protein
LPAAAIGERIEDFTLFCAAMETGPALVGNQTAASEFF